ncbi:hypothetical protein KC19_1G186500 [Ceratodon purpureus]|uniref:PhoD-like phosphatase metallophosphatase domain-containing protein n=1 Tax=Ceratodon purpureus TaxID=3225 RepID=A0A8T0J8R5_CERPU|nr:hypothetical protein KC19_1G186500 [Ceratodon purpureus]
MEGESDEASVGSSSHAPASKWKARKRNARLNFLSSISNLLPMYGSSLSRDLMAFSVEPQVIVGPVIGKVTATSARILIEIDMSVPLTIEIQERPPALEKQPSSLLRQLTGGSRGRSSNNFKPRLPSDEIYDKCTIQKNVTAKRPSIFVFNDLKPGTAYVVEVKGCMPITKSSFRTFPEVPAEKLTFGVISCNKIFITDLLGPLGQGLWTHLSNCIEAGKVDLLLHLGDQIYGDGDKRQDAVAGADKDKWSDRFRKGTVKLKGVPSDHWKDHQEDICEYYREVYRDTWRYEPTAKCLANCPNLMIYDDHEVRDNWGDVKEDWDVTSADFFVARCAWIVSMEYQRQLYEDVDFIAVENIHQDYHFHVVGGVGLMFIDIRGSRTFHRVNGDDQIYLGNSQWNAITKALCPDGIFGKIRALLVCSPAPLVFLEPQITKNAAVAFKRLEDFKGHWSFGEHINEQIKMIDALSEWKATEVGREVLVLGGDVHCGGHSEILKNDEILFRQLTTSAIANEPLPKTAYYFMRAAGGFGFLQEDYSFRHHKWTRACNYGLVQVKHHSPPDNSSAEPRDVEISAQLVKWKLMSVPVYLNKVSSLKNHNSTLCCPSGLELQVNIGI